MIPILTAHRHRTLPEGSTAAVEGMGVEATGAEAGSEAPEEHDVTSTAPWVLLFGVAMYSAALIGLIVLVLAFVRMSRAITRISQSLEEISAAMRSDPGRR